MRPSPTVPAPSRFECVECGARKATVESRVCDRCGGRLRNIAVERDL